MRLTNLPSPLVGEGAVEEGTLVTFMSRGITTVMMVDKQNPWILARARVSRSFQACSKENRVRNAGTLRRSTAAASCRLVRGWDQMPQP